MVHIFGKKGVIIMKVEVNNFFKDEKHKAENVNKAFAELLRLRTLDESHRLMVSYSKDLPSHDAAPDENEVTGHE